MKKLFISADIEGSCDIAVWDETDKGKADYAAFASQMNREVAAACEGALEAGIDLVLVRDAHDSARNIDHFSLPSQAQLIRGWAGDPLCMMTGLDESFHAAVLTGCHDAAGTNSNPLSHTMSLGIIWMALNGETVSESVINAYSAAFFGVPVVAVSGDTGLCTRMKALIPNCQTVPVNQGMGGAVKCIHPDLAVQRIREAVKQACLMNREECLIKLPDHFRLDVRFREHARAYRGGFYPGVLRLDSHTLRFEAGDWYEVLRMMQFCL